MTLIVYLASKLFIIQLVIDKKCFNNSFINYQSVFIYFLLIKKCFFNIV